MQINWIYFFIFTNYLSICLGWKLFSGIKNVWSTHPGPSTSQGRNITKNRNRTIFQDYFLPTQLHCLLRKHWPCMVCLINALCVNSICFCLNHSPHRDGKMFTLNFLIWKQKDTFLWNCVSFGKLNHAKGNCSHEIKRRLLLGRKAMTNLDSIFKSGDITLPTKVRLVKAMVFPVVMYGCESWTVKKAEHWRIDAFKL